MLVLSRKKGQSIMIGNNVEITIIDVQGEQVRLGINAPKAIKVHRKEVYEEIMLENRRAAEATPESLKNICIHMKISKE